MGNLLFSPSGRIGPSQYMRGMIIVAVISAVLALLPLVSPALGLLGSLVGFVFLYVFFALGIKRSHDAGKSGWMSITHFLLYLLVSTIVTFVIFSLFGLSLGDLFGSMMSGAADPAAIEEFTAASTVPGAIATLISYPLNAFLVNMLNPHDPTPNQYGNPAAIETTFE